MQYTNIWSIEHVIFFKNLVSAIISYIKKIIMQQNMKYSHYLSIWSRFFLGVGVIWLSITRCGLSLCQQYSFKLHISWFYTLSPTFWYQISISLTEKLYNLTNILSIDGCQIENLNLALNANWRGKNGVIALKSIFGCPIPIIFVRDFLSNDSTYWINWKGKPQPESKYRRWFSGNVDNI